MGRFLFKLQAGSGWRAMLLGGALTAVVMLAPTPAAMACSAPHGCQGGGGSTGGSTTGGFTDLDKSITSGGNEVVSLAGFTLSEVDNGSGCGPVTLSDNTASDQYFLMADPAVKFLLGGVLGGAPTTLPSLTGFSSLVANNVETELTGGPFMAAQSAAGSGELWGQVGAITDGNGCIEVGGVTAN